MYVMLSIRGSCICRFITDAFSIVLVMIIWFHDCLLNKKFVCLWNKKLVIQEEGKTF